MTVYVICMLYIIYERIHGLWNQPCHLESMGCRQGSRGSPGSRQGTRSATCVCRVRIRSIADRIRKTRKDIHNTYTYIVKFRITHFKNCSFRHLDSDSKYIIPQNGKTKVAFKGGYKAGLQLGHSLKILKGNNKLRTIFRLLNLLKRNSAPHTVSAPGVVLLNLNLNHLMCHGHFLLGLCGRIIIPPIA